MSKNILIGFSIIGLIWIFYPLVHLTKAKLSEDRIEYVAPPGYVNDVSELNETITFMNSTPHSMKLEEVAKPQEVEAPVEVEVQMSEEDEREARTELAQEHYEDALGDIEELMALEDMDF